MSRNKDELEIFYLLAILSLSNQFFTDINLNLNHIYTILK